MMIWTDTAAAQAAAGRPGGAEAHTQVSRPQARGVVRALLGPQAVQLPGAVTHFTCIVGRVDGMLPPRGSGYRFSKYCVWH